MPSLSSWISLLATVSAPLLATGHGVIDTPAVTTEDATRTLAAGLRATGEAAGVQDVAMLELDPAFAGEEELMEVSENGRALLRTRRKRGTSRASPRSKPKPKGRKKPSSKPKPKSRKKPSSKPKPKSRKKPSSKPKSRKKPSSKPKPPPRKKPSPKPKSSSRKKPAPKKPSPKPRSGTAGVRGGGGGGGGSVSVRTSSGKTTGKSKLAHGTFFSGMGSPTGGCGVPPSKAYDDKGRALPFVALNTNSEFSNGNNCGRWVEITLKENCVGAGNSKWSPCTGGRFVSDGNTGDIIYGYVMDSCADGNFWCQGDTYHLDISKTYLTSKGYIGGSGGTSKWNGRKISWKYMTGAPSQWQMKQPKFMWKDGSKWLPNGKGFYGAMVIYNVDNGIGGCQQSMGGSSYSSMSQLNHLGNMWVLNKPPDSIYRKPNGGKGQKLKIRPMDVDGDPYGVFECEWKCGSGVCPKLTDAPCKKVG